MKSLGLTYCATFVVSLALSFVLTRYIRDQALSHGWRSRGARDRDVHMGSIPRLGGVAIYCAAVVVIVAVMLFSRFGRALHPSFVVTILAPATVIFLLGLYDDLFSLGPYV